MLATLIEDLFPVCNCPFDTLCRVLADGGPLLLGPADDDPTAEEKESRYCPKCAFRLLSSQQRPWATPRRHHIPMFQFFVLRANIAIASLVVVFSPLVSYHSNGSGSGYPSEVIDLVVPDLHVILDESAYQWKRQDLIEIAAAHGFKPTSRWTKQRLREQMLLHHVCRSRCADIHYLFNTRTREINPPPLKMNIPLVNNNVHAPVEPPLPLSSNDVHAPVEPHLPLSSNDDASDDLRASIIKKFQDHLDIARWSDFRMN
ncbi:hypothetical protein BV25DRAFT_1841606 [Artomyces pyxidatus]|uniref:Uncharacterized protein n=1 Tax=Artomyces pyxidatus TaxID=48021 RepID=A0ACB8SM55_9AGAM|nr:hypothetical protein BV25DRAFT_1841606 [Artomyces pyxidatus]